MLALASSLMLAAAPVTYLVDSSATQLVALTTPEGLLAAASHGHAIEATLAKGEVKYDPAEPESMTVSVSVNPNLFLNDDPLTVKKFNVKNTLGDGDREKVARNVRSADQLDAAKFSTISFASSAVKKLADGTLEVSGTLSMHGVSVNVKLPVTVSMKAGVFRGEGELAIKTSDFGIKPFSIGLGTVKNADQVTIKILLVAKAKS